MNALLGALSVMLAGCHVQKKANPAEQQESDNKPVQEVREPEPEVKPLAAGVRQQTSTGG